MSVTTEKVEWRLTINGSAAKKELAELDQEAYELRQNIKGMKKGTDEYIAASKRLKEVESRMGELRKEIGLNGLTLKQLNAEMKRLNMIKQHLTPGTQAFKENEAAINAVRSRITQVKSGLGPFAQAWKNLSGEVKGVAIAFAGLLSMQIVSWFRGLIKSAGELDDQLADVRKVTGRTVEEVADLNKELGKIDTRTSRAELRELAWVAGKLGINAKDDVLQFVRAADQLKIALGKDLGEGAIRDIGKLVDIFKLKGEFGLEKAMLKTGSAINALGMASTASEGYLVEFTKRMSGLSGIAHISASDNLALAATLDSLGQTAEVSSTALNKLFVKMAKDAEDFAKMAKVPVEDFKEMMKKDAVAALKLVMTEVGKTEGGIVGLADALGDLGVDGGRVVGVLGTLSNNIKTLEEQQAISNKAFEEGTSVTNEFNIKNATLGATLEKLGKAVKSAFTSEFIIDSIKSGIFWVMKFVAVLKEVPNFISDNKQAVKLLTVAVITFNGALIASRLAALADIAVKKIQEIWTLRAEYAQHLLNKTMGKNPVLRIVSAVFALAAAYKILTNKTTEARKAQEELNERIQEGQRLMENTRSIEDRYSVISKLSKESLEQLQGDIQREIQAFKDKDAEMISWAWKNGVNVKLNELTKKYNAENDAMTKGYYYNLILRERELIEEKTKLQFGYNFTEAANSKKKLELYKKEVDTRLAGFKVMADGISELSEEEKKALEEAAKKLEELRKKIFEIGHQLDLDRMKKNEREIQEIKDKYAELILLAKGHTQEIIRLQDLQKEEILLKLNEQFAAEEKLRKEEQKKKEDLQRDIELMLMNDNQRELGVARDKWFNLIEQARSYGLDVTGLYRAMYMEMDNIQQQQYKDELEKNKEKNKELLQQDQDVLDAKADMMSNFSSLVETSLSLMGAKQGEYTAFQKGLAFTQILIDTANSMSNIIAGATEAALSSGPAGPFLVAGYIASGLATILGAFANAKAILSQAEVPAFAEGTTDAPPGFKLVGEKGPELIFDGGGYPIITNEDTRKLLSTYGINSTRPNTNFDFSPAIETINRRQGISQPAENTTLAPGASFNYDDSAMKGLMQKLILEQQLTRELISKKQDKLQAEVVLTGRTGFEQKQKDYQEIKDYSGR